MIELPPSPTSVETAVARANVLAYGFEKHKDTAYWRDLGYENDRDYFWRRLLGWQAGGDDVARFGLYAQPPSDWNPIAGEPAQPPKPPTPPAAPPVTDPPAAPQPTAPPLSLPDQLLVERVIDLLQQAVLEVHIANTNIAALDAKLVALASKGVKVHL